MWELIALDTSRFGIPKNYAVAVRNSAFSDTRKEPPDLVTPGALLEVIGIENNNLKLAHGRGYLPISVKPFGTLVRKLNLRTRIRGDSFQAESSQPKEPKLRPSTSSTEPTEEESITAEHVVGDSRGRSTSCTNVIEEDPSDDARKGGTESASGSATTSGSGSGSSAPDTEEANAEQPGANQRANQVKRKTANSLSTLADVSENRTRSMPRKPSYLAQRRSSRSEKVRRILEARATWKNKKKKRGGGNPNKDDARTNPGNGDELDTKTDLPAVESHSDGSSRSVEPTPSPSPTVDADQLLKDMGRIDDEAWPPWEIKFSNSKKRYYYWNHETGACIWTCPYSVELLGRWGLGKYQDEFQNRGFTVPEMWYMITNEMLDEIGLSSSDQKLFNDRRHSRMLCTKIWRRTLVDLGLAGHSIALKRAGFNSLESWERLDRRMIQKLGIEDPDQIERFWEGIHGPDPNIEAFNDHKVIKLVERLSNDPRIRSPRGPHNVRPPMTPASPTGGILQGLGQVSEIWETEKDSLRQRAQKAMATTSDLVVAS